MGPRLICRLSRLLANFDSIAPLVLRLAGQHAMQPCPIGGSVQLASIQSLVRLRSTKQIVVRMAVRQPSA
jgi:hypothetical protein